MPTPSPLNENDCRSFTVQHEECSDSARLKHLCKQLWHLTDVTVCSYKRFMEPLYDIFFNGLLSC